MTAAAAQASSMITLIRKLKITVKMPMKNKSRENNNNLSTTLHLQVPFPVKNESIFALKLLLCKQVQGSGKNGFK